MGFDFSILPLCTVGLFLVQQKMFMPPATTEQEVMQQKMMNFMTLIMGVFFWHQPAGLSVYFIASSLWGITERKLLGTGRPAVAAAGAGASVVVLDSDPAGSAERVRKESQATAQSEKAPKAPGFWQRLMDAAEEAQRQAESKKNRDGRKDRKK
jgi:YidC/Oxa1 family membrane protein insertase